MPIVRPSARRACLRPRSVTQGTGEYVVSRSGWSIGQERTSALGPRAGGEDAMRVWGRIEDALMQHGDIDDQQRLAV